MPKISIILPIYGVERFIVRCARSLFEQTLDDIEYIFVNDCTKDNSMNLLKDVLEEYPHRKSQVKILWHEKNKGLPQARATGTSAATGDYIIHCDTDDWVEADMYRLMYEKAVNENADIVICDYYRSNGLIHNYVKVKFKSSLMQGPVWNKLVNARIYKEHYIKFPTANKAEDGAIMTQLSYFSKKCVYINKALYYYFVNTESICGQVSEDACVAKLRQECDNVDFRLNFLNEQEVLDYYKKEVVIWKFQARNNLIPVIKHKKYYKMWLNTYPEINTAIFTSNNLRLIVKYLLVRMRLINLLIKLENKRH